MENANSSVKRRRGAQPGNQNARKNRPSLYSPEDTELMEMSYLFALDSLNKAVALTRVKIKSLLRDAPDNYDLILTATGTLSRLLQLQERVIRSQNNIRPANKP